MIKNLELKLLMSGICISMEMTGVLHLQINSCTTSQASSFWKVVEPWAPEPGLPLVELRIGRPAKAKMLIGIGTGLGPAKGAPMPLSVLIPRKTLRVNFCIGKYRSYLRVGERMVSYAFWSDHVAFQTPLDLRTRGELMTLRLEGCYWLWGVVLSEVTRLHPPIFALKNTCM
jgi:hypothetical protein